MIVGSYIAWDHFFIPVGVGQSPMQTIDFDTALANDFGKLWFSAGDSPDLSINHLIAHFPALLSEYSREVSKVCDTNQWKSNFDAASSDQEIIGGLVLSTNRKESMK